MKRFLVIIEKSWLVTEERDLYTAYIPDFYGCQTCGYSMEEASRNIRIIFKQYLKSWKNSSSLPIPKPRFFADFIDIED